MAQNRRCTSITTGSWPAHDYEVEISGGSSAAHYVSDYDEVAGIRMPTKHRIFPRTPDDQALPEPLIVSIDVSAISFS